MELYAERLQKTKKASLSDSADEPSFQGPADRSHLRLGMQILGMVYTCEIVGFLKLNKHPPSCTNGKDYDEQWAETDWAYTYERPEGLWTYS